MDAIRAAYLRAARCHHPDKLGHLDATERLRHEGIFKDVSDAYGRIVKERSAGHDGANSAAAAAEFMRTWRAPTRPEEWENIWLDVERMFSNTEVIDAVKDLFKKATNLAKATREARAAARDAYAAATGGTREPKEPKEPKEPMEQRGDEHSDVSDHSTESTGSGSTGEEAPEPQVLPAQHGHGTGQRRRRRSRVRRVQLDVSPADVQTGRRRRVRIVLTEGTEVFVDVDCGVFPEPFRVAPDAAAAHSGIEIHLRLVGSDVDTFETNQFDLFRTVVVDLPTWRGRQGSTVIRPFP